MKVLLQKVQIDLEAHSVTAIRNQEKESYNEKLYHNLKHSHKKMIENMREISKRNDKSTIFANLVKKYQNYGTCLITYYPQIIDLIKSFKGIKLSQKHYFSQSIILALCLSRQKIGKVRLFSSQRALNQASHIFGSEDIVDKLSYIKQQIKKEMILYEDLTVWNRQEIKFGTGDIVILDVFNMEKYEYVPFLVKNYKQICKEGVRFILYYSTVQTEEIESIISSYHLDSINENTMLLVIDPNHPLQMETFKQQKDIQEKLIQFLVKDSIHAVKQDIVIFYPLQTNLSRFVIDFKQLVARQNHIKEVNLIYEKAKKLELNKSNIFIVQSFKQLMRWNYDLSNVLVVIDYGQQIYQDISFDLQCQIQSIKARSPEERWRRMSLVGVNRIGAYYSLQKSIDIQTIRKKPMPANFIIKMIDYGFSNLLQAENDFCLRRLQYIGILKKQQQNYILTDPKILEYVKQGLQPVHAKILNQVVTDSSLSSKARKKYLNLVLMCIVLLSHRGSLKKINYEADNCSIKPHEIWRKSGYIQSCLDILTKAQLIQYRTQSANSKSQQFRSMSSRLSSKNNSLRRNQYEQQLQVQQILKQFQWMEIPDLIRVYSVNEEYFYNVREEVDLLREKLEIDRVSTILQRKDVQKILKYFVEVNKKAVAIMKDDNEQNLYEVSNKLLRIGKNSLLNHLKKLSEFIYVVKLIQNEDGQLEIETHNNITQKNYLEIFGTLPQKQQKTQEIQISKQIRQNQNDSHQKLIFNDISHAQFQFLAQKQGLIASFQQENDCVVQLQRKKERIIIEATCDTGDTRSNFQEFMVEINKDILQATKSIFYMGNVSFCLGAGGIAKDIVIQQLHDKCSVQNIAASASRQDLLELFKKVKVIDVVLISDSSSASKSAIVYLSTKKDYSLFYQQYHKILYLGLALQVRPLKKQELQEQSNSNTSYLEFRWFVWKSHGKALVVFKDQASAQRAMSAFNTNPQIDGAKVKYSLQNSKNMMLEELNSSVDEIYLRYALQSYGVIESIQILKTPLKEVAVQERHLEYLIRKSVQNKTDFAIRMGKIQKGESGLRKCRVYLSSLDILNQVSKQLDKTKGKMGQGHLYAQTWFQAIILVPLSSISLYSELLESCLSQFQDKPNIQISKKKNGKKTYIVLRSGLKQNLDIVYQKFSEELKGRLVDIPNQCKKVILSDIGIVNILDIEQKYQCKLIPNFHERELRVQIPRQRFSSVQNEIRTKINTHIFYSLPISKKDYRMLQNDQKNLQLIKKQSGLKSIELEEDIYALILQGPAVSIQKALQHLSSKNQLIVEEKKETEKVDQKECCAICAQIAQQSLLLCCKHKFCYDCLQQYMKFSVRDVNLFPLKCPLYECKRLMNILDLDLLMDGTDWSKLVQFASTRYLTERSDLTVCYTAGCNQINHIKVIFSQKQNQQYIKCSNCQRTYCTSCKSAMHFGDKCADILFQKYMKQNGVRRCVNTRCRVPVVRWTGCYKVHCSRCNINMCFKCPPEQMVAYVNENDAYRHLAVVHGGFF